MLLKKKSNYSVESEWAVILDRSENEFSKNRALNKLTEIFSLAFDEAKDLIDNTPIILLDHLPLDVAEKIKTHFSHANVNCSLTNDTFTKRKCFRAVWPEQPNLTYFLGETSSDVNGDPGPIRSSNVERAASFETELPKFSPTQDSAQSASDEQRQLKELTADLQKENELLQIQLRHAGDLTQNRESNQPSNEIEKLSSERTHLEETTARLTNENAGLVSKVEELERNIKKLKEAADNEATSFAKAQSTELRTQLEHFRSEYARAQSSIRLAQGEAQRFQAELAQIQGEFSEAHREVEDLKRMLSQAQGNSVQLRAEMEQIRFGVENRLQAQSTELEEWKRKANDWSVSYFKVIKENEFLRAHQSEELESLRARNRELSSQLEQAQKQIRDSVAQLEQQELVQKRMKTTVELTEREAQLRILVQKQQTLETEIRLREEEMKKVLLDQEVVEQEIVKTKQAQKYLIEQSKIKERPRFSRPKVASPDISSRPDAGSLPPTIS